jgi:hypothetical protein
MTRGLSWHGDWHGRIYERVRGRGFETVTAFAEASPRATMFELVAELGAEDVNVAQVVALMRSEAESAGTVERFARGLLVHELYHLIPKGWRVDPGNGFEFEYKAASAIASTSASLPDSTGDVVMRLGRIMLAADLPVGWLPEGPDDPILVGLFERTAKSADPC